MKFTKIAALAAVAVMACGVFYGCGEEGGTSATTSSQAGTSQGGQKQETTLTGTWKFAGIKGSDGKVQNIQEYVIATVKAQTGQDIDPNSNEFKQAMQTVQPMFDVLDSATIEIKDGGSVVNKAEVNGEKIEATGSYTVTGDQVTLNFEGQPDATYTFDAKEGTLSIVQQGMTVVLKKA